jgi:hypothetical protein
MTICEDRLERDMRALALLRRSAIVMAAIASTFVMGLLVLTLLHMTAGVSRSVTTAPAPAAPNWNAAPQESGAARP